MKLSASKPNLDEPPELPINFNSIDSIFDENIVEDTRELLRDRGSALNYYWDYLMISSSKVKLISLAFQFICAQVTIVQTDYWLAYWYFENLSCNVGVIINLYFLKNILLFTYFRATEDQTHRKNVARGLVSEWDLKHMLFTRGTFIGAIMIGSFLIRNITFLRICARSGDIIHRMMFDRLMGSSLRLFSKNSAGMIGFKFGICLLHVTRIVKNVEEMLSFRKNHIPIQ